MFFGPRLFLNILLEHTLRTFLEQVSWTHLLGAFLQQFSWNRQNENIRMKTPQTKHRIRKQNTKNNKYNTAAPKRTLGRRHCIKKHQRRKQHNVEETTPSHQKNNTKSEHGTDTLWRNTHGKALGGRIAWNSVSCIGHEHMIGTAIAAEVLVARTPENASATL